MKHIKLYENYKDIENICNQYNIHNYIINNDNTIDVNEHVSLLYKNLTEIPLQFGKVIGHFNCERNKLESLKGSPYYVEMFFSCTLNKLNTLEYCPKYIGTSLGFSRNNIYSLDNIGKVNGNIHYYYTPIEELINIFNKDAKLYLEYLDMYNFQKEKVIYKTRFMDALKDLHNEWSNLPKLKNYQYQS